MISYEKFWKVIQEKGLSQYKLIRYYKISSGQLNRIRHNNYISTRVIDKMCNILDCQPSDIMEVFPDDVAREYSIDWDKLQT